LSPEGFTEERLAGMSAVQLAQERENDRLNRDVFEEQVDLVLDAWTQDSLNYRSNRWELPYPYDEGIEWGMASVTKRLGAPGEIGANGRVRAICVCPTPYTQPHPTVFVASNASVETVEYCGGKGFIPTYFSSIGRAAKFGQAYVERAKAAGHNFALGQNQALVRWVQFGKTNEAARQAVQDYDVEIYKNLYQPLTPSMPFRPDDAVQSVLDSGLFSAGTPEEVRAEFVQQWEEMPAEYVVLIFHYSQMPKERVVEGLEQFMTSVKASLDEMTEYP